MCLEINNKKVIPQIFPKYNKYSAAMLSIPGEEHEYLYFKRCCAKVQLKLHIYAQVEQCQRTRLAFSRRFTIVHSSRGTHSTFSDQPAGRLCAVSMCVTLTRRIWCQRAPFSPHTLGAFTHAGRGDLGTWIWLVRPRGRANREARGQTHSKRKAYRRTASTTLFPPPKQHSVTLFPHNALLHLALCLPRLVRSPTADTHKSKLPVSSRSMFPLSSQRHARLQPAPHDAPPHHSRWRLSRLLPAPPGGARARCARNPRPSPRPALRAVWLLDPPPPCVPRPLPSWPPPCVSPCSPRRTGGARGGAGSVPKMASIMEGPLSKWTNVMKGWQYRWFVLDYNAGLLSYYTVRGSGGPGGRGAGSPAEAQGGGGEGTRGGVNARAANGEGGGGGRGQWGRKRRRARPMGWRCGEIYRWGRAALLLLAAGVGVGAALGRGCWAGAAVGAEGRSLAAFGGSLRAALLGALERLWYCCVPGSLPQQQSASSSTLTVRFRWGLPAFEHEMCETAVTQYISCLFFF